MDLEFPTVTLSTHQKKAAQLDVFKRLEQCGKTMEFTKRPPVSFDKSIIPRANTSLKLCKRHPHPLEITIRRTRRIVLNKVICKMNLEFLKRRRNNQNN